MLQNIIAIITAAIGSLGFSLLYNIRGKRIFFNAFGGGFFWAAYLWIYNINHNSYLSFFVIAIFITLYAEIGARIIKTPTTTILTPTSVPLIPGGSLYYAMDAALRGDSVTFFQKGTEAIGLAIALAGGIMVVTSARTILEKIHIYMNKKWKKC